MNYEVPGETNRVELRIKNSRFIATVGYTPTVEDAKSFVAEVKSEFSDASHNVPAYVVGHGASVVEHCNDDGEPSGTAGRPMLAVLKGSGLGDVTVVVTRYFGGTKLGTGGLVQAYGESVKTALASLKVARKAMITSLKLQMPYAQFEQVKRTVIQENGEITAEDFAADVSIHASFEASASQRFRATIQERWPTSVVVEELGQSIGILKV